ncbi:hypothetical protein D3C74_360070 [compost metagenome]
MTFAFINNTAVIMIGLFVNSIVDSILYSIITYIPCGAEVTFMYGTALINIIIGSHDILRKITCRLYALGGKIIFFSLDFLLY